MSLQSADRAPEPLRLPRAQVLRIVLGLLLSLFLAALDQMIVSIALVAIAGDLGRLDLVPWVVSGYLVASTVATPIYGKLSDLFGRWPVLAAAIVIYVVGAGLSTLAQSMSWLLAFRLLQGIGGGGLISLVQTVVADVAPGPERGRYQGYLAGVFAIAAVAGPLLGGLLTHYLSWRAVFGISVPLGLLAFALAARVLRTLPIVRRRRPIDYAGALLLGATLGCLMTALTRIGQGHGAQSVMTLGLFCTSALAAVMLAWREHRAPEPILPPSLLANRTVWLCCVTTGMSFVVLVGVSVLLPMLFLSLGGMRADQVALWLVPISLAVPVGSMFGGRAMWGLARPRTLLIGGAVMQIAGMAGLSTLPLHSPLVLGLAMVVGGLGVGITIPPTIVAPQEAVPREQVGIVTATTALCRTLGSAFGIAALSAVLFGQLEIGTSIAGAGTALKSIPAESLAPAFTRVFEAATLFAAIGLAFALALPRRGLSSAN
ncbi:MAG: MFS transporter [Burkholderiaceae bacterium]|nr:MFS transporter [Burkholderiaceae bacterium]